MKKTLFIVVCIASLLSITSCGEKKPAQEPIVAPQGMNVLDLSKFGKPFAIFVPDTIQNKLTVIEQSYGALEITVGPGFAVSITEQAEDIELKKKDVKEDEVNKVKSFMVEEPTAIFWESAVTDSEYHFVINQKVGTGEYCIQDLKNTEAKPFDKASVQKMYDSAKNIKEVKKEAPNA